MGGRGIRSEINKEWRRVGRERDREGEEREKRRKGEKESGKEIRRQILKVI